MPAPPSEPGETAEAHTGGYDRAQASHLQRQVAEGFGADAGRYDRARPTYPADLVDRIIAASPGFVSLRVERCLERPGRFLLLVHWERLENHTQGFRGSPAYAEWRRRLHHFYDPFPVVEHFEVVVTA